MRDRVLLDTAALTQRLGLPSHAALRQHVARGNLPAPIKIGRRNFWREDDIEAFLQRKAAEAEQGVRRASF